MAYVSEKGPEQTHQYTVNLSGTLIRQRTSFSLSATGTSLYDSAHINAITSGGATRDAVRRPADRANVNGRVDHALTNSHTLRSSVQTTGGTQTNLGVGGFDLGDRAYARTTDDTIVRLSETGPWARDVFAENRLQLRHQRLSSRSAVDAPTVQVLDTFSTGGAQQAGRRESTELEWALNVDWARRGHAVRAGSLVEGGTYDSDTRTNYLGTFVFASLDDYAASRPATFTQRVGDARVQYGHWQAALFVQDDWRISPNLTVSAGLRQELQSHLDGRLNLAPRASFTWSPFKNGRTTVRGGAGVFYDWLEAGTYEQVLRVDGTRQRDLIISSPGYPDPTAGGAGQHALPASRYVLGEALVMPKRVAANAGISYQLSRNVGFNAGYSRARGDRFRGRNLNAPIQGARPDRSIGNVTSLEATGGLRNQMFIASLNVQVPARRLMLFANYAWLDHSSNSEGPLSVPSRQDDLAGEWGPVSNVPRHSLSGMFSMPLVTTLRLSLTGGVRSGTPYNITTGRDENGDGLFNERPDGIGRNTGRTAMTWEVGGRLSYAFGFGQRQADGTPGHPTVVIQRIGGSSGSDISGSFGGGADDKRVRIELFVSGSNLFNAVNHIGYSGVVSSPFFGRPTAAMPGRRIDLGVRVGF